MEEKEQCWFVPGGTNLRYLLCDGSHGLTEVIMCTILGPNCFSTQFRSVKHKNEIPIQFSRNIVHNTRVKPGIRYIVRESHLIFCTQFKGNIVCPRTVDTQSKFVRVSLTNNSVHKVGV